ncbi:four-carbon acid sugar kinase family protein [Consotaella aegiceratis]|uniref:four-carbon acid sugar kinase family protein n=1 Tax=Consotaella aegiceratis TaxID=3097961 RepID=UPI002F42DCAA
MNVAEERRPAALLSGPAVAVVADDLTGATDSGLQFANLGLPTTVCLDEFPAAADGAAVVVVDTETRALEPAAVRPALAAVSRQILQAAPRHVYKKIDSTMRGHVGVELDSVAAAMGAGIVILTPAFPAMGRTVEDGRLFIEGLPVGRTAIARDPGWPVRDSRLASLLAPHMPDAAVVAVSREALDEPARLHARLQEASHGKARVCAVFDASNDDDLARIAGFGTTLAQENDTRVLWAGSAGLAAHLPIVWGLAIKSAGAPHLPATERPPLLVVGSVNPTSIDQLARVTHDLRLQAVVLSPDRVLGPPDECDHELVRAVAMHRDQSVAGCRALVLTTAHDESDVARIVALAERQNLTRRQAGRRIAESLAAVTRKLLEGSIVDRLAATGGDTARAILDAAGIRALRVEGAVAPGMPLVTTQDGGRRSIMTKAGGFGSPDALVKAMTFLADGRLS